MNVPLLNSEQLYQAVRRVGKVDDRARDLPGPVARRSRRRATRRTGSSATSPGTTASCVPGARREDGGAKPEATSLLGAPLFAPELRPERQKALEDDLAEATRRVREEPRQRRRGHLARPPLRATSAATARRSTSTRAASRSTRTTRRLLRHRGHRYISVRELDKAVADLSRAAALVKGQPDEPEPGSDPKRPTTTTLQFSVFYHLGLAHYLKGDFAAAEKAYRQLPRAGARQRRPPGRRRATGST